MNCPHCQQVLPEKVDAVCCPFCQQALPPAILPLLSPTEKPLAPVNISLSVFFLVLFVPPVLTMISAWLVRAQNESASVAIALFGGGAAGITCGIMLGLRLGSSYAARVVLCLLFVAVMIFVCIMLCFLGCNLGGYQFQIH